MSKTALIRRNRCLIAILAGVALAVAVCASSGGIEVKSGQKTTTTVARNAPKAKGPKLTPLRITKRTVPSVVALKQPSCTYNPKTHEVRAGGALSWVPAGGQGALGTISVIWSAVPKNVPAGSKSHKNATTTTLPTYALSATSGQFFSGLWSLAGTATKPVATCAITVDFAAPTAESVFAYLAAKALPMTGLIAFTAASDPNHLLGRPTGYLSKCAWQDSRIPQTDQSSDPGGVEWGGGIEVFSTAAGATHRASYLATVEQADAALGSEYDYILGPILLRISGTFTPDTAASYGNALTGSSLYVPQPPGTGTTTTAP
jgi:hypothetical protein